MGNMRKLIRYSALVLVSLLICSCRMETDKAYSIEMTPAYLEIDGNQQDVHINKKGGISGGGENFICLEYDINKREKLTAGWAIDLSCFENPYIYIDGTPWVSLSFSLEQEKSGITVHFTENDFGNDRAVIVQYHEGMGLGQSIIVQKKKR